MLQFMGWQIVGRDFLSEQQRKAYWCRNCGYPLVLVICNEILMDIIVWG